MTSNKKTKWGVGIFEFLTIVFIVLKLTGTIDWNWGQVLSPAIIAFFSGVVEGIIEAAVEHHSKHKDDA